MFCQKVKIVGEFLFFVAIKGSISISKDLTLNYVLHIVIKSYKCIQHYKIKNKKKIGNYPIKNPYKSRIININTHKSA